MYKIFLHLVMTVNLATAYQVYQTLIPNGANIPDPCQPNTTWPGVGHKLIGGTGDRNQFGLDFANNSHIWSPALCRLDSDNDGRTNGEELGDPNCVWTPNSGNAPAFTTGLTHPGICEPIASAKCKALNDWLSCETFSCPAFSLNSTMNISLTIPLTPIPVAETTYVCRAFKLPSDRKYHIIGMKPVINNTNIVHHMIIYGCPNGIQGNLSFTTAKQCALTVPGCPSPAALWTKGVAGDCYSDQYGIPMGQSGLQYVVLEIHWNNAMLVPNQYDSSGLMLFYTSDLRPNDGQIVMFGQMYLNIPPGQPNISFTGGCTSECTQFLPQSVNIVVAVLHMHLLGKSGEIKLINSNGSNTIYSSPQYEYSTPKIVRYDTPIPFSPGDEILVGCIYQSLGKNTTTSYGEGIRDEMCYAFLTIYPAIPTFDYCTQYKELTLSIPICPLLGFPNCNWDNFWKLITLISVQCDGNCTKPCHGLIDMIYKTGCFKGSIGAWLDEDLLHIEPNLAPVFNLIQNICAPATTASSSLISTQRTMPMTTRQAFTPMTTLHAVIPTTFMTSTDTSTSQARVTNGAAFVHSFVASLITGCLFLILTLSLYIM